MIVSDTIIRVFYISIVKGLETCYNEQDVIFITAHVNNSSFSFTGGKQ